ncbi:FAD/FMN-containing dehydrogenase [Pseudovibrio ascidiaceicola]|uniref:FAD/FMN-containing dehydrogenase n=1 Tax=Pseudovibrio ascidiaceicola TaxID=285279 RepID=A0A1I3YLJ9_9HYPH|nr:FAD-binding oxidoreductase [Pseudovibrio ascidiaceicola]SFK32151.1 FAD/FMN-containing dehydrogenase [Pseudovibrio ascidiaceicola]
MGKISRRAFLLGGAAFAGAAGYHFLSPSPRSYGGAFPTDPQNEVADTILSDAGELTQVTVKKHETFSGLSSDALRTELSAHFKQAADENHPVMASVARHSMGGQTLPTNGAALSLHGGTIELHPERKTYTVSGGVRWHEVITKLDANGFSPAVMQSNNDFGVASTFSVNAHGWPVPFSGCGSTVQSLEMVLADGQTRRCSPSENSELFNAAMGGYGLFGIITELELEMVPNSRLLPEFIELPSAEYGLRMQEVLAEDPSIQMAYGRMNVDIDRFFEDSLLIVYRPDEDQSDLPAASGSGFISKASRHIFRGQLHSESIKRTRWDIETGIGASLGSGPVTRNSLLNEPVITLDDKDPNRTDILHEYFVEPARFAEFIKACQDVIPSSYQELLNITLRYVRKDTQSVLPFAPTDRIAAVMLFSQEKSKRGEADMARMTRKLIERTLEIGGTYYLPYRLHARQDQFERAYPDHQRFIALKQKYDPQMRFTNQLWDTYMSAKEPLNV